MTRVLAILALAGVTSACTTQRPDTFWYADSNPPGAILTTDIGLTCVTPCRLEVPRWKGDLKRFNYAIEKPGYETMLGEAAIGANDTLAGGIALSLALAVVGAPTIPGPLDNKGYREIEPNPLSVDLVPLVRPAPEPQTPLP
jgi:hypothetical protein